ASASDAALPPTWLLDAAHGGDAADPEKRASRSTTRGLRPVLDGDNGVASARRCYCVTKEVVVIVWLPPLSIASTSNPYSVPGWRNSGGTVTLVVVPAPSRRRRGSRPSR